MAEFTFDNALTALHEPEPDTRRKAASALGLLSAAGLVPDRHAAAEALLGALGDAYADVRAAAVGALGQVAASGTDTVWQAKLAARIVTATNDPDASARVAAVRALGHLGTHIDDDVLRRALVTDGLIVGLDDFDGMVRREVIAALEMVALLPGQAPLRELVIHPLAVTLAEDDDRLVGYYAARALGRIGAVTAAGTNRDLIAASLTAAMNGRPSHVQKAARRALAQMEA